MSELVYYWRGSAEVRSDIIAALSARNYDVRQFRTLEDILEGVDREPPAVIFVDGSAGDREASQRVIELANTPKLYTCPILFISAQAEKRSEVLEGNYVGVVPINVPYRLEAVIAGAEHIMRKPDASEEAVAVIASFRGSSGGRLPSTGSEGAVSAKTELQPQATTKVSVETTDESTETKQQKRKRRSLLPENTEAIRRRMAKHPDPARLKDSFGGVAFALAHDPADFNDAVLLPKLGDVPIEKMIQSIGVDDRWLGAHVKRVAFVSSAIANELSFNSTRDQNVRVAGLFLNWGLRDRPVNLIRHDLILNPSQEKKATLVEGFLQSATYLEERCASPRAAEAVRAICALLRGENFSGDKEIIEEAEAILGVELSARSCWALGFWDPYGAYRSLRHFRTPESLIRSPQIKQALSKVLGEAVSVHITVGNYFVSHLEDADPDVAAKQRELIEESERSISAAADRLEREGLKKRSVPISGLTPGMLLLNPVIALDGRLVLDANVVLNEQIVLDLWQLAAVRALKGSVEVAVLK